MIDALLRLLAPHECLGCNIEGSLFCADCRARLVAAPASCYRCLRPAAGGALCATCQPRTSLTSVHAVTTYQGVAKDIIWKLKFSGAQVAAKEIASLMAELLPPDTKVLLVHAPTATSHVRQRGYDQAILLTRAIARHAGYYHLPVLARLSQTHQVGASREQRRAQLDSAFRVRTPQLVKDAHIVLVDDVLTTGATLEAAAKTLKLAGAARVDAIVFAQA